MGQSHIYCKVVWVYLASSLGGVSLPSALFFARLRVVNIPHHFDLGIKEPDTEWVRCPAWEVGSGVSLSFYSRPMGVPPSPPLS